MSFFQPQNRNSQDNSPIKIGFWHDWERNSIFGSTLTLPDQYATIVLVGLTILVTVAANRSWHICRSLGHALLGHRSRKAGSASVTRREQQVIIRNSETAGGAFITLILRWFDDGFNKKPFTNRSTSDMILSGFVLGHWIAFILAGVLVSQVVLGKLVISKAVPTCGQWYPDQKVYTTDDSFFNAIDIFRLKRTVDAETYVRNCYPDGGSYNVLDCNRFPLRSIKYKTKSNVACPFKKIPGTCWKGDNSAFKLDSGNITLNQMGINIEFGAQIAVSRRTTCAVIDAEKYRMPPNPDLVKNIKNTTWAQYSFIKADGVNSTKDMFFGLDKNSLQYELVSTYYSSPGSLDIALQDSLQPEVPSESDLSIVLLQFDGVWNVEPSDDPFFSAHDGVDINRRGLMRYRSDSFVHAMACTEQKRLCSSITQNCTPWTGLMQPGSETLEGYFGTLFSSDIGKNSKRTNAILKALLFIDLMAQHTSIYGSIGGRGAAAAVQLSRYLIRGEQTRSPPEQWKTELEYWFSIGLARFQIETFVSVDGSNVIDGIQLANLWDTPQFAQLKHLCGLVKFRDSSHTSMSVFGIFLIIGFCTLLIVVSLTVLVLQEIPPTKAKFQIVQDWARDDVLSLLKETEVRQ